MARRRYVDIDVKDPGDGAVTHVKNHITWAPNHQAIQFVTDFNGKPHYNGFYAYDPVKKTINFYYTVGGRPTHHWHRHARCRRQDAAPGIRHDACRLATTQHIRSTIVRDGNNAYDFSVFLQNKAGRVGAGVQDPV